MVTSFGVNSSVKLGGAGFRPRGAAASMGKVPLDRIRCNVREPIVPFDHAAAS
jgi:hypothetical protein